MQSCWRRADEVIEDLYRDHRAEKRHVSTRMARASGGFVEEADEARFDDLAGEPAEASFDGRCLEPEPVEAVDQV